MMAFVADLSEWRVKGVLVVEWRVREDREVQRMRSRWPRVIPWSSSPLGPRIVAETGQFPPQGSQVAHT